MSGALLSVSLDSALWGRLLWPELEVLWFNTAENKSGDWGTSPLMWYFYSALPRALLGAIPLAAVGCVFERRVRGLVLVALTFVGLYSILPHKELRFIFPAIPLINVAAAAGGARSCRMKGIVGVLASFVVFGLCAGTLAATIIFSLASSANYPGGVAMVALHTLEPTEPALSVHIGNLAATTGVSRFLEGHASWVYSKEEGLNSTELSNKGFDRLLTEWPEVQGYTCLGAAVGYEGLSVQRRWPILEILKRPQVFLLARSNHTVGCGEGAPLWT